MNTLFNIFVEINIFSLFMNEYFIQYVWMSIYYIALCLSVWAENGYGIPVVMVVLEGGPDAIQDVSQSLKEGIPVVVCTGTGRAADILTYAHNFTFLDRKYVIFFITFSKLSQAWMNALFSLWFE